MRDRAEKLMAIIKKKRPG